MMENLKISIVQTSLFWEDKAANLRMLEELLLPLKEKTDVIVLPEMFTTGFTMKAQEFAEPMNGPTVKWMRTMARELNTRIIGSIIIEENGHFYNRLIWVEPWDIFGTYDKRHLFRMANEHHHYTPGKSKLIESIKGWRICPLICYDLRFPVWSRNKNDYDVLIFIANWPEKRNHAWKTLLMARAIENQCYVIGVNRVGEDGNGISYSGDSAVINPKGEIISSTKANEINVETLELIYNELAEYRKAFPVGLDADDFEIT
ncbi:MAG: amidohydrolase [Bacteroidia bacterium]